MIQEYVCCFEKDNKYRNLKFKIYQNELTEIWSSVIQNNIDLGNNQPISISSNLCDTEQSLNNDILSLIKLLEKYDKRFDMDWPTDYRKVTSKNLNKLHKLFHFIEENIKKENSSLEEAFDKLLQQVNNKIHNLESAIEKVQSVSWYINKGYGTSKKITDDVRKYWNIKFFKYHKPGTIFLGYHTIGKSLVDCYRTNDVDLVRIDGVRQQEYISSEVIFYPDRFIESNNQRQIKKWLKNNNLNININSPKFKYNNQPALGFLETKLSKKQVINLFSTWNFYKVDIY